MNKQDFSLCSNVCERITERYGDRTFADMFPEKERNVVLVWTVSGIVENGGFRYLFDSMLPGDPDYALTIMAFEAIGCMKAVEVIRAAICLFSNCQIPLDQVERVYWFDDQPQEIRDALDRAFWNELDSITAYLAEYIRQNTLG